MRQEANYKEEETVSVRELIRKGKNKHLNTESREWNKSKWKGIRKEGISQTIKNY